MLSAARSVLSAGASRLSSSPGDQSLFLRPDDAAMRWFLLPSDHSQTTPPFQPRTYPSPTQDNPLEQGRVPSPDQSNVMGTEAVSCLLSSPTGTLRCVGKGEGFLLCCAWPARWVCMIPCSHFPLPNERNPSGSLHSYRCALIHGEFIVKPCRAVGSIFYSGGC